MFQPNDLSAIEIFELINWIGMVAKCDKCWKIWAMPIGYASGGCPECADGEIIAPKWIADAICIKSYHEIFCKKKK